MKSSNRTLSGGSFATVSSPEAAIPPSATGSIDQAVTGDQKAPLSPGAMPAPVTSNIDPVLLGTLQQYASEDLAKLETALNELPESSRLILQHAVDDYNSILNTQAAPAG